MKIAIYDKWLNSFGGGEKVATVMAEALSQQGHKVDLISSFDVEKKDLEKKMGVDLSKVEIILWYERSYTKLLPKTKKYDLFINVSFLDHLPSAAKKSIYYIHFPTPIKTSLFGFIKYETILPFLRNFLIIPEVVQGLNHLDDVYTRGGRWLSRKTTIVFSNTPKKFDLTLRLYAEQLSMKTLDSVIINSPNSELALRDKYVDHESNVLVYKLAVQNENESPALTIHAKGDLQTNAIGLVSLTMRNLRFFLWNVIKRHLPRYEMALYGSASYKVAEGLDTYDLLLANSEFSKHWTKKYLDKKASVLYPPVDVALFKPGKKKNIILTVGRFFVGGHSKRQDILVEAFKKMYDKGKIDTWELHLVGGVAAGKEHAEYVNQMQKDALGYPIHFHFAISFEALRKLYASTKIYWHAAGYGVNGKLEPIRLEHFGITPVEAMAAGCVPVVYKAGGVTETVGSDGRFLWKTQDELIAKTEELASAPSKLVALSAIMQKQAAKFSRNNFKEDLMAHIENLKIKK